MMAKWVGWRKVLAAIAGVVVFVAIASPLKVPRPGAAATTTMEPVALTVLYDTVTVPAPTGVADGSTAAICVAVA